MPNSTQKFLNGKPAGVSNVVKDSTGRLSAWTENGYAMALTRDTSGRPTQLTASSMRGNFTRSYTYDAAGNFQAATGDRIPTIFADDIWRDAVVLSASGGAAPGYVTLSANKTLTNADLGKTFMCSTAITVTVPVGLNVGEVKFIPPQTGNLSIASDGTATLNGATTTITRAWANNRTGFHLASLGSNVYGVGGA